jgi:hypothetical protein
MALMRTSRKATKGPGDPVKPKKIKQVTVTGDKYAGYNEIEKEFLRGTGTDNYVPGGGRYSKGIVKMNPSQLEEFNKQNLAKGGKLKYKEVRYDPNNPMNKDGVNSFQGDFAHPERDRKFYQSPVSFTPKAPVKTPEKVEVGKLPTRKLGSSTPSATLQKPQKRTEMVNKAIEGPGVKGKSFKKKASVTNRLKSVSGLPKVSEDRKFRKEEKLAGAYTRTKSLADENQGPNVVAGAFSKEKKAGYKAMRSDLKAARKETGVKIGSAMRDTRKAQKFEKKEQVGKTSYFTKAKMNEKVEKKPGMKGRMQAGKMRYS